MNLPKISEPLTATELRDSVLAQLNGECWRLSPEDRRRRGEGAGEAAEGRGAVIPPHVRAECQRILDREARRLLLARMDGELVGPVAGGDVDALDHGADQVAAPLEGELVPVTVRLEREGRAGGGA